jgi:hypothetical protein
MLKKSLRIPLFFFHGILCALQLEAHEREDHFGRPINVMAQNLYVGADLLHVGNVGSPEEIPIAVVETLQA